LERFDPIRFVYVTEDMIRYGAFGTQFPDQDWDEPGGLSGPRVLGPNQPRTGVSEQDSPFEPRTPENTKGKEQDEVLLSGLMWVDPCWLLNEYEGLHPTPDSAGDLQVTAGKAPLSRGGLTVVVEHGYGLRNGSYNAYQPATAVYLQAEDGTKSCTVVALTGAAECRPPGAYYPSGAKSCVGESLGEEGLGVTVTNMWDTFKVCFRTYYPECGTEPAE